MTPFKKYVHGGLYPASGVYDGLYNDTMFKMCFASETWFNAELNGIHLLEEKPYAPEILDIDYYKKEITFKWYDSNLNHLFFLNKELPEDYQDQIKNIIKDLEKSNIYKLNLYPHTFYLKGSKIHIMDLHACVCKGEKIFKKDIINVINNNDRFKFNNDVLDLEHTYNYTIKENVGKWPGDFLNA